MSFGLALAPIAFGVLALLLGQDGGWDLRNYHFYNPWAFLHGRMDMDVAPAHNATFYNPLLHLPFYYAVTHLPPRAVAFLLGSVQGMNLWLVYGIARYLLPESSRGVALLLAAVGTLGAGNLAVLGTSASDNVVSLPVLASLLLSLGAVAKRKVVRYPDGSSSSLAPRPSYLLWREALAGALAGIAAGLKLPATIFAVGLCAGFLVLPWGWAKRLQASLVFGIGVLIGVALADGFWLAEMWRRFSNPLFPYFNDVFHSPWAALASFRDPRFLPDGWIEWLAFPLVALFDPAQAGDTPFLDLRLPLLYLAVLALLVLLFRCEQRIVSDGLGRYLLVACMASYVFWLKMFAIQRYVLVLEMLAPLGVWLILQRLLREGRVRRYSAAGLLVFMVAFVRPADWERVPFGSEYFDAKVPPLKDPQHTLVLMADHDATAYMIPFFPPGVRFLRIEGYFTGPSAAPHEYDRLMIRVIREHTGDIYILFSTWEIEGAQRALAFHHLTADWQTCVSLKPNRDAAIPGDLLFCATNRTGMH